MGPQSITVPLKEARPTRAHAWLCGFPPRPVLCSQPHGVKGPGTVTEGGGGKRVHLREQAPCFNGKVIPAQRWRHALHCSPSRGAAQERDAQSSKIPHGSDHHAYQRTWKVAEQGTHLILPHPFPNICDHRTLFCRVTTLPVEHGERCELYKCPSRSSAQA